MAEDIKESEAELNNEKPEEKELNENISEFHNSAISAEEKKHYNVAVTLYFKTLAVLADLYIFRKEGKIPSSHSERFRILESKYQEIYALIDKNFSYYQQSYRIKLNKEICEVLREDVARLIELLKD